MKVGDKLYRYKNEQDHNNITRVKLEEFVVIDLTPEGYWFLNTFHNFRPDNASEERLRIYKKKWAKWGRFNAKRSYAYPTKKEALESFRIRKVHQISYCKRDIRNATSSLRLIEEMNETL